jgi:hypothetical protein
MREKKKTTIRKKKFDKGYKKDKTYTKKKHYGQAHVGQKWNSSDESSESKSDDLAPQPSRAKLRQASLSSPSSQSTHVLWQRKVKRR